MTTHIGQIKHSQVSVAPSKAFLDYIRSIKALDEDIPLGLQNIICKNKSKDSPTVKQPKGGYLISDKDKKFISSLELPEGKQLWKDLPLKPQTSLPDDTLLTLQDLHWLFRHIQAENRTCDANSKVYLHELLENSEIVLPKNEEIPRNRELEKRCQKLKAEQQNREYQNMTKNVDGFRRKLPEDTISYQLKMMNTHLIAVFQFIVSVLAGFAFGFIGIELLVGSLDFGFRLMLGTICALVIAIAELYFLAKKLNEDLEFETKAKNAHVKVN
ncbi:transmembrane protein 199 [Dendroctonus ponderosae]|uniref:Endoplasmic reticulum-based factor for assembly of V-ATPase n=1 Tax=Dendroctonus ponderosae TaxID=77166 RepID=U4UAX8_DENPD|nr:transmembrane protein 199 [Dendroctonus ponderosae]ERL87115.1 hypothetical protein D910_04515 [Dendroctonus ponderosae]KAH1014908.1 hypothetical protein HUJ05_012716 [Dendroctonus ponderosae]